MGSGRLLKQDQDLIGLEYFHRTILCECPTREEALMEEAKRIKLDIPTYNLKQGNHAPKQKASKYGRPLKVALRGNAVQEIARLTRCMAFTKECGGDIREYKATIKALKRL